ncbi:MAG TPA: LysE family transporter [Actinomycetes bacterium]
MSALVVGLGLGAFVAAQVGPVSLLCARTSMRHGFVVGAAVGAGAALVDLLYACLGVAGVAALLQVTALRVGLGLVGAGVLVFLGVRTFRSAFRVRLGAETDDEVVAPWSALRTAVAATASNPLTIASWAAIFSAAAVAAVVVDVASTVELVVGVGIGSLAWFTVLAAAFTFAGRRVGTRGLAVIDGVAGLGLIVFGGVLAVRSIDATVG